MWPQYVNHCQYPSKHTTHMSFFAARESGLPYVPAATGKCRRVDNKHGLFPRFAAKSGLGFKSADECNAASPELRRTVNRLLADDFNLSTDERAPVPTKLRAEMAALSQEHDDLILRKAEQESLLGQLANAKAERRLSDITRLSARLSDYSGIDTAIDQTRQELASHRSLIEAHDSERRATPLY